MLFHPHLHMLVPAVALAPGGCALKLPKYEEFLLPVQALSAALCEGFKAALAETHPELFAQVDSCVWEQEWVTHCKEAGRGRTALRYLAAYVKKSALSDERLLGYDAEGRVLLRWKPSGEKQWQVVALEPLELIRRWLLHVLPKGLVRVRHYGWLAAAAGKAFLRVRYLLGMRAYRKPRPIIQAPALSSCCGAALVLIAKLPSMRGPPLSRQLLRR